MTAFADPHVQFGLRFQVPEDEPANDPEPDAPEPDADAEQPPAPPQEASQVVSLDAFRRRSPSKE